mmetsp:Transcript_97639/g.183579  ORF Transcript_97639/g.183579 Transcript_97639/m.183579 type:complete len:92 (-) Transcript_97639:289-564(-)
MLAKLCKFDLTRRSCSGNGKAFSDILHRKTQRNLDKSHAPWNQALKESSTQSKICKERHQLHAILLAAPEGGSVPMCVQDPAASHVAHFGV